MAMVAEPRVRPRQPLADAAIEPMRQRHLRGVLAIERRVYPQPWTAGLFADELRRRDTRRYLVALAPDPDARLLPNRLRRREVVGYAGLLVQAEQAHITTVAVHPRHHRRKIATRLLVALLTEARAMGATSATLEVRAANRGAQRLYSSFGFVPVGVRPGYYRETQEDAVIMWAHELQAPVFAERLAAQAARLGLPGGASGAPDLHVPWVQGRVGLHPGSPADAGAGHRDLV